MSQRALLQFVVILIGVLFESVRTGQSEVRPFIISDQLERFRSYVYYLCEHLKFIAISVMMWLGCRASDFKTDRLFVLLAALDFFDYIFWGNNLWYQIVLIPHGDGFGLTIPFSMNVFSLVVFGLYSHYQWKMNGERV